jgi:hypothetical protein
MHYLLVEDNQVTSILNYEPNVPDTVTVVPITDEEHKDLTESKVSYFDIPSMQIKKYTQDQLNSQKSLEEQNKINAENREFLNSTDWKILRHLRETTLGVPTSLSQEQYLDLEQQRKGAASRIV